MKIYEVVTGGVPVTFQAEDDLVAKHLTIAVGGWHYALRNQQGATILQPFPQLADTQKGMVNTYKLDPKYLEDPENKLKVASALRTAAPCSLADRVVAERALDLIKNPELRKNTYLSWRAMLLSNTAMLACDQWYEHLSMPASAGGSAGNGGALAKDGPA
jgi:hypothetical protein